MRHLLLLVLLASTPACSLLDADTPSVRAADGIRTTRSNELNQRLTAGDRPLILDVRTPQEFASGHIPSAQSVPLDQLRGQLDALPRDQEIYVICEGGARSRAASQTMAGAGLLPVDVEDGMSGWRWRGLPTE